MMAGLWWSIAQSANREAGMMGMLAGLPGHWLPVLLHARDWGLVVWQCVGGVLVMAGVGLLLDGLRVPARWMWVYLAGWAVVAVVHIFLGVRLDVSSLLFWSVLDLYAVSIGLGMVGGVILLQRKVGALGR